MTFTLPGPPIASSHLSVEDLLPCETAKKCISGCDEAVERRLMKDASATAAQRCQTLTYILKS